MRRSVVTKHKGELQCQSGDFFDGQKKYLSAECIKDCPAVAGTAKFSVYAAVPKKMAGNVTTGALSLTGRTKENMRDFLKVVGIANTCRNAENLKKKVGSAIMDVEKSKKKE